jgi:hypothetical protein
MQMDLLKSLVSETKGSLRSKKVDPPKEEDGGTRKYFKRGEIEALKQEKFAEDKLAAKVSCRFAAQRINAAMCHRRVVRSGLAARSCLKTSRRRNV